jgi:phosphocarrier protein
VIRREVKLVNRLGLHARAASKLVRTASAWESDVFAVFNDRRVNAKSIMGVLLLAAPCGSELVLEVHGPDEADAVSALERLVAERFGESE